MKNEDLDTTIHAIGIAVCVLLIILEKLILGRW